jgi:hypothetical protein
MTQMTVSDEQARLIAQASFPIIVVDSHGRQLGQISPVTSAKADVESSIDDWAEAKRQIEIYNRQGGSFYTTKEVLEHLTSLEKE